MWTCPDDHGKHNTPTPEDSLHHDCAISSLLSIPSIIGGNFHEIWKRRHLHGCGYPGTLEISSGDPINDPTRWDVHLPRDWMVNVDP